MNPWAWLRKILGSVQRGARPTTSTGSRRTVHEPSRSFRASRRQWLGQLKMLPALGLVPWSRRAAADEPVDAVAAPTPIVITAEDSDEYRRLRTLDLDSREAVRKKQRMPVGKIGNLTLGRLICGSNLISMNMHARDLYYVNGLARAYNTEERIFMTLKKCEENGCNSIILKDHNFRDFRLADYWTQWGGKMVWLADVITRDIRQFERRLVQHLELGAASAYLWGGAADTWYYEGNPGNIVEAYEIMRRYDIPVGIAAHRLEPIAFCEREGLQPDYYMLTLHHDGYWSAHPRENRRFHEMYEPNSPHHAEYHDNMFCHNPEETAAFMQDVKVPWIAFKVLAAGAIRPNDGIQYAFDHGADFICLGMFDYQVEEDAQLIQKCAAQAAHRRRPWS
jgi:hypothetical protein